VQFINNCLFTKHPYSGCKYNIFFLGGVCHLFMPHDNVCRCTFVETYTGIIHIPRVLAGGGGILLDCGAGVYSCSCVVFDSDKVSFVWSFTFSGCRSMKAKQTPYRMLRELRSICSKSCCIFFRCGTEKKSLYTLDAKKLKK